MSTNKHNNIEFDDMMLKSHLNASLDKDKINVSEELINRTLAAIKSQQSSQDSLTNNHSPSVNRVVPFSRYVRSFAGVAAAALILVVGIGAFMTLGGAKKDMEKGSDNSSHIFAGKEADRAESADYKDTAKSEDSAYFPQDRVEDTANGMAILDSFDAKEDKAPSKSNNSASDNMDEYVSSDDRLDGDRDLSLEAQHSEEDYRLLLTFSDILPTELEEVENITINIVNEDTIYDIDSTRYKDMYSLFSQYTYSNIDEPAGEVIYAIIIDSSKGSNQINIGDSVSVKDLNSDVDYSRTYNISDYQQFIAEIKAFISN